MATGSRPILPLPQAAFTAPVATGHSLTAPVTVTFSAPMDQASVAAALAIDPPTAVNLAWDRSGTTLTVVPAPSWAADTYHTITVGANARTTQGRPLAARARTVFITRPAAATAITPTQVLGPRVLDRSGFRIDFGTAVDSASVESSVSLDPPVPGSVVAGADASLGTDYTFVPSHPLAPDTTYTVAVAGVRDADGLTVPATSIVVRTADAPGVVRFRPRPGTSDIARTAAISVRFTKPMDRAATAAAFRVTVSGRPIRGSIRWAESDTVLVLTPKAALPAGAAVVMEVGTGALSAAGVPVDGQVRATFRTVSGGSVAISRSGGGGAAVGGGSWGAVETYYLKLMNCTRTGGWVTASGSCSSPGGRNVAPLRLDAGISSHVSRPYARRIAISGDCSHFIGGNPGDRLRAAGYDSYRWAENIGCRSGDPYVAVLGSHLFFQDEKSSNGGHYVNLMNAAYDRVGIGVWVAAGRVRLVIDFYHP